MTPCLPPGWPARRRRAGTSPVGSRRCTRSAAKSPWTTRGEPATAANMSSALPWCPRLPAHMNPHRYGAEDVSDRAQFLDERIQALAAALQQRPEGHRGAQPVAAVAQDPVTIVGRVLGDFVVEGHRMNEGSVLLEGSTALSKGHHVKLSLEALQEYSLFPGQVSPALSSAPLLPPTDQPVGRLNRWWLWRATTPRDSGSRPAASYPSPRHRSRPASPSPITSQVRRQLPRQHAWCPQQVGDLGPLPLQAP